MRRLRLQVFLTAIGVLAQTPIQIGPTSGQAANASIAANSNRTHVIFAYDTRPSTRAQIFVATSADGGRTFGNPVQAVFSSTTAQRLHAGLSPKTDSLLIVWTAVDPLFGSASIQFTRSVDGGIAQAFAPPVRVSPSGVAVNPRMAVDPDDNVFVVWESGADSILQRQIQFARSSDGGKTFSAPLRISGTGAFGSPNILWHNNRIHVAWRETAASSGTLWYALSTDGGQTFSTAASIAGTANTIAPYDDIPSLAPGPAGGIGVLYRDAGRSADNILYVHSSAEALPFGSPAVVGGVLGPNSRTGLVSAPVPGGPANLVAAWSGLRISGGAIENGVFVSCTTDPGAFRDPRVLVTPGSAVRDLASAADPNGVVHLAYTQSTDRDSKLVYVQGNCVPRLSGTVNTFSRQADGVVAGSLATVTGVNLGPGVPIAAAADERGVVPPLLAGAEVRFDGIAAPVVRASRGQIDVQVPFELSGQSSTRVTVTSFGFSSEPIEIPLTAVRPALRTAEGNGTGAVFARNSDGASNREDNAAQRGSEVTLYVTGHGGLTPSLATGQTGPPESPPLVAAEVSVRIGGSPAKLVSAGAAPGEVGTILVKALVPNEIEAGLVSVDVAVGGIGSQGGTTLAVR